MRRIAAVRGMTLTTIRDGTNDHVGIRTSRGIVDVALAAQALNVASAPRTVDDVIAGRGDVRALARIAESALSLSESERFRIALVIDAPEPLTWSNHLAGRYPMSGIRKFDRARFA